MKSGRIVVLLLAGFAGFSTQVAANGTRSWSASTPEQFAQGTLDGTAIDQEGSLRLGPLQSTVWGPEEGVVWGVGPAGAGAVFVALSGPGRLLRVDRDGGVEVWFEADSESMVTALAPDGAGGVYIGLSPEGQVLRLSSAGEAETVVETEATFVWSLALDPAGALWIGTGIPGLLLRRDAGGEIEELFAGENDPVRCIAPRPTGGVVFGTGGEGRVVRVDADGGLFVMHDADEAEIAAVAAAGDGTVYALGVRGAKQVSGRAAPPRAAENGAQTTVRVVANPPSDPEADSEESPQPRQPRQPSPAAAQRLTAPPGGVLYRLATDGGVRAIWKTEREMPFAMLLRGADELLVATGDSGHVYRLDLTGRSARLMRVSSDQASALTLGPGGELFVGGTTDARLERVSEGPRAEGEYLSPAVDAGTVADWGRVEAIASRPKGTKLSLALRSGNSAEPDETWGDWAALDEAGESTVPPARWGQLRVRISSGRGASPAIRSLELFYRPRNRAPEVTTLNVEPPGVVITRRPVQSSSRVGPLIAADPITREATRALAGNSRMVTPLRRSFESGTRTLTWKATDPDGDRLSYSVQLQRDGEAHWFSLADGVEEQFLSWDSRGMPSGLYRARLIADDGRDNADGERLDDQRLGELFVVDNAAPFLGRPEVTTTDEAFEIRFDAEDPGGRIVSVEVAVDGLAWRPLSPLDGVADSDRESYRLILERTAGGAQPSVMVRVTDAQGNLGGDLWELPSRR